MKYKIIDYELSKEQLVEAPGILEAMLDYLPWPTLDLQIHYAPAGGYADVIDSKTDFKYRVQI